MAGSVFISYSRADEAYVARLFDHFRNCGLTCWYDEGLRAGDVYPRQLATRIETSAAVVVVMTAAAADSTWVANEIEYARTYGRPILPLLLSGSGLLLVAALDREEVTAGQMPSPHFTDELLRLCAVEPGPAAPPVLDPTTGVLVAGDGQGVWAWAGVRVDHLIDLGSLREYQPLTESGRLTRAVEEERAFLTGLWDLDDEVCVDLRYVSEPAHGRIAVALLGRVRGADESAARAAALGLRARLGRTPAHVAARPIADEGELGQWLAPFIPAAGGLVDIRKRIRIERPNRPDAGNFYLAVDPFVAAAPNWAPLGRALLAHPHPVLLSVNLRAVEIGQSTTGMLDRLATEYRRLGQPGFLPGALAHGEVPVGGDAFAADAAVLYGDAARRYQGRVFRARVSVASPAPLPAAITELIGITMSPPDAPRDAGALTATLRGPAHVVVRPGPDELDTARRNIAAADNLRWDGEYVVSLATPPPPFVRLIADLVDAREATAIARLPVAPYGEMPGFPVRRAAAR